MLKAGYKVQEPWLKLSLSPRAEVVFLASRRALPTKPVEKLNKIVWNQ